MASINAKMQKGVELAMTVVCMPLHYPQPFPKLYKICHIQQFHLCVPKNMKWKLQHVTDLMQSWDALIVLQLHAEDLAVKACTATITLGTGVLRLQLLQFDLCHACSCKHYQRGAVPSSPEGLQHHLLPSRLASLLPSLPLPLPWTPHHTCNTQIFTRRPGCLHMPSCMPYACVTCIDQLSAPGTDAFLSNACQCLRHRDTDSDSLVNFGCH